MANIQELTKSTFDDAISSGKVLVDFWATWCGPCRMQAPILDKLAGELTDVKFAKVDVDAEPELAQRYGIMSIPTLVLFNNGQVEKTLVGLQGEDKLKAVLK